MENDDELIDATVQRQFISFIETQYQNIFRL